MKQEDRLNEKVGKKEPYKVPGGYFDSMRSEVFAKLPAYPEKPKEVKISAWQRVKPYLYLAAMFAGIWCMMKVFHNVSNIDGTMQDPQRDEIAMMMNDPEIMDYYMEDNAEDEFELQDEVINMYSSIDELKKDFYSM